MLKIVKTLENVHDTLPSETEAEYKLCIESDYNYVGKCLHG